jgi:hypothetical protein
MTTLYEIESDRNDLAAATRTDDRSIVIKPSGAVMRLGGPLYPPFQREETAAKAMIQTVKNGGSALLPCVSPELDSVLIFSFPLPVRHHRSCRQP